MKIEVHNLHKTFDTESILKSVSFSLAQNQTLSILGPSGCGKSTLLKILAGMHTADSGSCRVDGKEILKLPPQTRDIVYLSQEPLLFPHLSIFQNLAFGLHARKRPKKEIQQRVTQLAEQLGVAAHLNKKPTQLSGGQRQRVSFGRALIIQPSILLLDEPFSSLDSDTRQEMQQLFMTLKASHAMTALFVTHELKEALQVGDQWAQMQQGTLRLFTQKKTFLQEASLNLQTELDFWKKINKLYHANDQEL